MAYAVAGGMVAVVAVLALLVLLYRRVGRPDWGRSDLRMSTLAFLAAVGPFFGIRIREQRPEVPSIATPRDDDAGGTVTDVDARIDADAAIQAPPPVRRRR